MAGVLASQDGLPPARPTLVLLVWELEVAAEGRTWPGVRPDPPTGVWPSWRLVPPTGSPSRGMVRRMEGAGPDDDAINTIKGEGPSVGAELDVGMDERGMAGTQGGEGGGTPF